jgi:hypothetical protein
MKRSHLIVGCLLMCGLLLASGCTQPSTPPPTTTAVTTAVTTAAPQTTRIPTTAATSVSSTPGPVETLPPVYGIDVQVDSNGVAIDPNVIVTFRGGQGINFVTQIDAILTRGDGVIKTGTMLPPFSVGQTINLPSTAGNQDRVQVWVTLATGNKYLVIDQYVPFRSYH